MLSSKILIKFKHSNINSDKKCNISHYNVKKKQYKMKMSNSTYMKNQINDFILCFLLFKCLSLITHDSHKVIYIHTYVTLIGTMLVKWVNFLVCKLHINNNTKSLNIIRWLRVVRIKEYNIIHTLLLHLSVTLRTMKKNNTNKLFWLFLHIFLLYDCCS